jgi:hypothetical protein
MRHVYAPRPTTNQLGLVGLLIILATLSSLVWLLFLERLVEKITNRLVEKLKGVSAAQEQTNIILSRLAKASDIVAVAREKLTAPPVEEVRKQDRKDSAEGSLGTNYPHNAYKKLLARLGVTSTEQICEERMGLTLVHNLFTPPLCASYHLQIMCLNIISIFPLILWWMSSGATL